VKKVKKLVLEKETLAHLDLVRGGDVLPLPSAVAGCDLKAERVQ